MAIRALKLFHNMWNFEAKGIIIEGDNQNVINYLQRSLNKASHKNEEIEDLSFLEDFVSMRPIPLAPIMEKLSLTAENYGSVRRYFIQMLDDRVLSPDLQEKLVRENPPCEVFKLKGSDHCPFFSKPQSLCKILLEIVQLI
ncbi:Putative methylesterase 14, chloroplastic [Dendrobium catenatum]|uniref:Methylesterase 14, chloroplastic n=1 Tax=Dendrobium catenatum TaxID=906689 RepID=A0A2I0WSF7_9ASPA|nr:Putative methylesterase 14, chloroplastic [Dendrobium catenatum]